MWSPPLSLFRARTCNVLHYSKRRDKCWARQSNPFNNNCKTVTQVLYSGGGVQQVRKDHTATLVLSDVVMISRACECAVLETVRDVDSKRDGAKPATGLCG